MSGDGQRLYIQPFLVFGAPTPIIALDTTTGLEVGRSQTCHPCAGKSKPNGRILVSDGESGVLAAIDAVTLHTMGSVQVRPSTFTLLPGRWMTGAYLLRTAASDACPFVVEALGPDGTLRIGLTWSRPPASIRRFTGSMAVLLRSPFAPATAGLSGERAHRVVVWANPGDVSGFELQVPGLSPGSTLMRVPLRPCATSTSVTYARCSARGILRPGQGHQ